MSLAEKYLLRYMIGFKDSSAMNVLIEIVVKYVELYQGSLF